MTFWSVTYIDWPPLQSEPQRQFEAICRKAGEHCYIFVEKNYSGITQASVNSVAAKFDTAFFSKLTSMYGSVPDAQDCDSSVYILALDENNWGGYFDPAQQMTDSFVYQRWGKHSNEKEILYIAADAFSYADEIISHEFGHLLHWGGDHSPEPIVNPVQYWEEAWIDEQFSTFAEVILLEDITEEDVYHGQAFFQSNPDKSLIYFSDYNQVRLFMLFMFEHYGNWQYVQTLMHTQLNGIDGIDSVLMCLGYNERFPDVYLHWSITNYVDDNVHFNGRFAYNHYNTPQCYTAGNHSTFPLQINNRTIKPYGSDYIAFTSSASPAIRVTFNGQDNTLFKLALLKLDVAGELIGIDTLQTDSLQNTTFNLNGLGTNYNKAVLVVANVDSSLSENQSATYSYSADVITGLEDITSTESVVFYPNPAVEILKVLLNKDFENGTKQIAFYDINGKQVYSQSFEGQMLELTISNWDAGVYKVQVSDGKRTVNNMVFISH